MTKWYDIAYLRRRHRRDGMAPQLVAKVEQVAEGTAATDTYLRSTNSLAVGRQLTKRKMSGKSSH